MRLEETILASIGNMKGGVSKSTMTSSIASFIHNSTDYSVCVIDADDLQRTLTKFRKDDLINLGVPEEEIFDKEVIDDIDLDKYNIDTSSLYHLLQINSIDFPAMYEHIKGNYDFVFIDLPGNLKQSGVFSCYCCLDYIFIPTGVSSADLDSSAKFFNMITSEVVSIRKKELNRDTKIFGFLSRIDRNNKEYKEFIANRLNGNLPFNFLNTDIPESKPSFQRKASSMDNYSCIIKRDGKEVDIVEEFCLELLSKMGVDLKSKTIV